MTVPESTYTIILILVIIVLFTLYIVGLIKSLRAGSTGRRAAIPALTLAFLLCVYLVFNVREIEPADWAQIVLLFGLVVVTGVYAMSATRQADTSVKMAKEMKEQRVTASRPVVVQQAIYEKDIWEGSTSNYFSHFEAYNKGNGPAIEVEISLLDNDKNLIESHRKSFLGAGEPPIEFRPTSLAARQENSTCYLVCEYQSILSSGPRKMWYQTWLPFKPSKSSEKDKMYIVAGELEFCEVSEKERIDAFSSRSKPK